MKPLVIYHLRSKGEFDVSEIAKGFGGGGHRNSAGFTVAELSWKSSEPPAAKSDPPKIET